MLTRMGWNDGVTRPVSLDELGQGYRRYRLANPEAEDAMAVVQAALFD